MKPAADTRKPYNGQKRSLVLALDIGTTFSGVSYAILEPGEVPKIHGVTRFPGQEHVAGNSKIPSIMYYDQDGNMKAAGAEADGASVLAQAEDEQWFKTELFKLRLRPKSMTLKMNGMRLSPLPHGKSAVDVFGDFLSYLFRCTHSFIVDTHANGPALWRAVENDIQFVLSHPNGWEGAQQTKMRRAAIHGGLIPDTNEGKARIRFVTEGEASLHACVLNGLAADVLQNPSGHGFVVADAGGGTLDISSYAIRATAPLVIEEIAPPDCVFAGSVFVSRRARKFFEEKLKDSRYGSPDSLDHITKRFDETTKRLFRDNRELQFVPFGSPLDKDMNVGIRGGQLKLTGDEVAALFEPSIEAAVSSIRSQMEASHGQVKSVWLVGGFAASPWLFTQLQERLKSLGISVSRPDSQTSKAVADGAIGFYCDHHVSARMSKFMYGVEYLRAFDANDAEHKAREHRLFEMPSGPKLLPDAFDCILARNVKVKESTVFSRKYCTEVTNLSTLSVFEVEIWCFRGGDDIPKWILRDHPHFSTLCYVRADLSPLAGSAEPKEGKSGKSYWGIVFSIEIHFGLTEFKARIKWVDNGQVKYGPASIVYNEMGHRAEDDETGELTPDDDSRSAAGSRAASIPSSPAHATRPPPSRSASRAPSAAQSPHPSQAELRPTSRAASVPRTPTLPRPPSDRRSSRIEAPDSRRTSIATREASRPASGGMTPRAPEIMDRSVNVSNMSTDSRFSVKTTASAAARLDEALTSVWGRPTSTMQTPTASPRGEAASYFEMASRNIAEQLTSPEIAPAAPPPAASHIPTPSSASKSGSPAVLSRSIPSISKPPSPPPAASGSDTPHVTVESATPEGSDSSHRAASKVATPRAATPAAQLSAAATPRSASKAATPRAAATPGTATPKPPSPLSTPHVPEAVYPRSVSKVASRVPSKVPSKAPSPPGTPQIVEPLPPAAPVEPVASKVPTPAATPKVASKAPSKAPSKVPTPKAASKAPSPKQEPAPLVDSAPIEDAVIPPMPADMQAHAVPGAFEDWSNIASPDASKHRDLADLLTSDQQPEGGGLSSFLGGGGGGGPQWGAASSIGFGAAAKKASAFGSSLAGGAAPAWGAMASTFGSGISGFGAKAASAKSVFGGFAALGGSTPPAEEKPKTPEATPREIPPVVPEPPAAPEPEPVVPPAPATPAASTPGTRSRKESKASITRKAKKAEEEAAAAKKAEEAAAALKAAEAEAAKKAAEEEATRKATEEEAARKAAEEEAMRKAAEEEAAKKAAEEEAAKQAEEARLAAEAAAAAKAAEEAAAAQKAADEAAAAQKAADDAAAVQKAAEEAEAAKKAAEEEAAKQAEAAKAAEEAAAAESKAVADAEAAKKAEEEAAAAAEAEKKAAEEAAAAAQTTTEATHEAPPAEVAQPPASLFAAFAATSGEADGAPAADRPVDAGGTAEANEGGDPWGNGAAAGGGDSWGNGGTAEGGNLWGSGKPQEGDNAWGTVETKEKEGEEASAEDSKKEAEGPPEGGGGDDPATPAADDMGGDDWYGGGKKKKGNNNNKGTSTASGAAAAENMSRQTSAQSGKGKKGKKGGKGK